MKKQIAVWGGAAVIIIVASVAVYSVAKTPILQALVALSDSANAQRNIAIAIDRLAVDAGRQEPPVVNVTVPAPVVNVSVPPAVINVPAPVVTVPPAVINVDVPPPVAAPPPLREPLRASELQPGQVLVDGLKGRERLSYYPLRVLSNIPGATKMRMASTRGELAGTEWRPYAAETMWPAPVGLNTQYLLAEYQTNAGVVSTTALVPDFDETLGKDYVFPLAEGILPDPYDPDAEIIWSQKFEQSADRWVSYDYNGGVHGNGNVFYPASWSSEEYIWTDDSRWRKDTPENPTSILALLTYPHWLVYPGTPNELDFSKATISLQLRGKGLDLKGGSARLFINTEGGRWHSAESLQLVDGQWSETAINMETAKWEQSWDGGTGTPGSPILTRVMSFGIKFTGFGDEPTGRLELDDFTVRQTAD